MSAMRRKKMTPEERTAFRQLGRRIAAENGIAPMSVERDPETGRFDPPGFYGVRRRPMFDWRQFLANRLDGKKKSS